MQIPERVIHNGNIMLQKNQEAGLGSHLQAGARAFMIDSPLTRALATRRGQLMAQTMKLLFRGNVNRLQNYAATRPYARMEGVRIALGEHPEGQIVLDPATGYSPGLYWLAEEFPETQFIEIDTHEVIEFKRAAYQDFGIRDNLRLKTANLLERDLHDVLNGTVDVLVTNGAYVSHEVFRDALAYLHEIIKDNGSIVVAFPYQPGIENFTDNSFIFSNVVSTPVGALVDESELDAIFVNSGFSIREVIRLPEIAQKQELDMPAEIEIFVVAQRD